MDPVLSTVLLGFVLGVQHATDPDHLVAVATIVSRQPRFLDGARIGTLWGLGHTATLSAAALALVALDLRVPPVVSTGLELAVAAMLVALGLERLRAAARGLDAVVPGHLLADHDHGGAEVVHSHPHEHGGHLHAHPHVHPSRRLLAALVGAVHGLAGSAAVSLLVLVTLRTAAGAAAYVALFGVGTILGMTLLTAALAYPVGLALRVRRARGALGVCAGLGSLAFGVAYALHVLA